MQVIWDLCALTRLGDTKGTARHGSGDHAKLPESQVPSFEDRVMC